VRRTKTIRRIIARNALAASFFLLAAVFIRTSQPSQAAQFYQEDDALDEKVSQALLHEIEVRSPEEMIDVIVTLKDQVNLHEIPGKSKAERNRNVIERLQSRADKDQKQLRSYLEAAQKSGLAKDVQYYWIFNGIALRAEPGLIEDLARFPEVESIAIDEQITLPETLPLTTTVEANITAIGAPDLWALGYRGQGVVVANMDTGVNLYHPDLQQQWRGGTNSWLDVTNEHYPVPGDPLGHGTAVMGVMIGGDEGGTAIGVAPKAQWIAVKIFNKDRVSDYSWIHSAFQWLLDPDNNPSTPDAPDVVNNSWTKIGTGCDLQFQPDLQALRAVGILPIFAAGNLSVLDPDGPNDFSPGNNLEAFAVGAFDDKKMLYEWSSRGPSSCDDPATIYPEITAPGVNIRSYYGELTGTSLAAPHAAGGLALLLSAFPFLPLELQEQALIHSAEDLGELGPDNDYGNGGLDLMAAYIWINENYTFYKQYLPMVVNGDLQGDFPYKIYFPIIVNEGRDEVDRNQ